MLPAVVLTVAFRSVLLNVMESQLEQLQYTILELIVTFKSIFVTEVLFCQGFYTMENKD